MGEKPRVLVVYGYHPRETYAFDIGIRLAKDQNRDFLVERYAGKADKRRSELDENYERNLHTFIRTFGTPYAIVLHNSEPDFSRERAWRRRMLRKNPDAVITRLRYPMVSLHYETRRKLPEHLHQYIGRLGSKYFPNEFQVQVSDEFARWPDCMPAGIDELAVEFYVFRRPAKSKSVEFVKILSEFLTHESDK